ncbi:hypothetical protein [Rhodoflexus caldus]|uniref:hypothetical protein n=1 Tax=Rhodoflexus caldus TaxID=2891236 RepID=UPI002029BF80|nr:hypothetical protein [Rhodoflexus caldus]
MKTIHKIIIPVLGLSIALTGCDKLKVIDNPVAITPENATAASGTVALVANALKNGFEAHQQICWSASLIGREELRATGSAGQFIFANRIEAEGVVATDNSQNSTNSRRAYTAHALVAEALNAIQKNTFSTNPQQDAKAKALLTANAKVIEGLMYLDFAKFYEQTPEPGTGNLLSPEEAKTRAIAALQAAKQQFQAYSANTAADPSVGGSPVTTGLLVNTNRSGEKLCDSLIGMLHFDTGTRNQAAAFLQNGYTAADAATQAGYRVINALTGPGLYPPAVNYISFRVNDYSDSFVANRIPGDVNRRGAPVNWFDPALAIETRINYFYPVPPGPGAITPVVLYPLITWQEVALMLAELGQADRATTVFNVVRSWGVPDAQARTVADNPTEFPISRIARYEYVGRGRRWSQVNAERPNTYRRWPLSFEFLLR